MSKNLPIQTLPGWGGVGGVGWGGGGVGVGKVRRFVFSQRWTSNVLNCTKKGNNSKSAFVQTEDHQDYHSLLSVLAYRLTYKM